MLDEKNELILETCLLAGKIMIENNAEMYRIENTMERIAITSGNNHLVSFVTQTGLFVGFDNTSSMKMAKILHRTIDLESISKVNDLSRNYSAGNFSLEELLNKLKKLEDKKASFSLQLIIFCAAILSATIMVLFGGKLSDCPITFLIGYFSYTIYHYSSKILHINFLPEFIASLFISAATILCVKLNFGSNQDMIIIGCIMPLVPGGQITNSIRDLVAGHYLSGVSRGAEAAMIAFSIGLGVAINFQFFY